MTKRSKEFWVLGVVNQIGKKPRVRILPSTHVLPKGVVLSILTIHHSQSTLRKLRKKVGDEAILNMAR